MNLVFRSSDHTYWTPEGRRVPSVTEILKGVGLATDFESLMGVSPRLERQIATARQRGTNVHLDTHAWDDAQLNLADVDPALLAFVAAWIECRRNLHLRPVHRERLLWHPGYDYCGTMDGVFHAGPDKELVLPDLKTGDPKDAGCRYQTAAYAFAWNHAQPDQRVRRRLGIWLQPGKVIPYRTFVYDDPRDIETFLTERQRYRPAA